MTSTNAADPTASSAPASDERIPPEAAPWMGDEDTSRWRVVARGRGKPRPEPLRTVLAVELTREQVQWVRDQAAAAGLDQVAFVADLIEAARMARD